MSISHNASEEAQERQKLERERLKLRPGFTRGSALARWAYIWQFNCWFKTRFMFVHSERDV